MPAYSGYAFQNDSDRSATLENLTPISDPIASTTSTQLKLSSFPNPHIAWIYYKVDALTHFILETKFSSPTISGQPITTNYGDVTSSITHPNWNHEPTVDMRNAPNSFGITSSDPIEAFSRDTDVGGEASRICCGIGVTDGTPLVSANSTPFRVDYTQTYSGFSASVQDTWSNQDLSSLTTTASIPDVPVRIVGARLNDSGANLFRMVYPRGSSLRPMFIANNSHADANINLNFNSLGRSYLSISEEPSIDILSFDNSTPSDLTLYLQRA